MRTPEEHARASTIIRLMEGVVYRESQEDAWRVLSERRAEVSDHFHTIGIRVVVDETEGYAYLKTIDPEEGEETLPRLVRRRSLTYNVSLLLLLLRKRLAEFEAGGTEGKLVLEREQIMEMLRVFLPATTNEARVIDQADRTINQVRNLGFLAQLPGREGREGAWEVRRIIKAYVDAETMSDFAGRLATYAQQETAGEGGSE